MNYIEDNCEACGGGGKKLSFTYLKHLIENEITSISCELNIRDIYIEVDAYYKAAIMKDVDSFALEIGGGSSKLYVKFSDKLHNYKVEPLIFPNVIEKMQKLKIYG
jgi:ribonuclease G